MIVFNRNKIDKPDNPAYNQVREGIDCELEVYTCAFIAYTENHIEKDIFSLFVHSFADRILSYNVNGRTIKEMIEFFDRVKEGQVEAIVKVDGELPENKKPDPNDQRI